MRLSSKNFRLGGFTFGVAGCAKLLIDTKNVVFLIFTLLFLGCLAYEILLGKDD